MGHAAIFDQLRKRAEAMALPPVVLTFDPHPRVVVTPNDPPLLLTTAEEKVDILRERFDGSLIIMKFDDSLRTMTADDFATKILLEKLGIKSLVVGFNHSFGHKRSGNIDNLKRIGARDGFGVEVVGPVMYNDMPISSSRIRRVITIGQWRDAMNMLGHPYPIRGKVIHGQGKGKDLGWPTINIEWAERKLLPCDGVYACSARLEEERFHGMMFIGVNMLNPQRTISVEAHLFDFDRDVYEKEITLCPWHFIRENRKFPSATELARQIAQDKQTVIELLHKQE